MEDILPYISQFKNYSLSTISLINKKKPLRRNHNLQHQHNFPLYWFKNPRMAQLKARVSTTEKVKGRDSAFWRGGRTENQEEALHHIMNLFIHREPLPLSGTGMKLTSYKNSRGVKYTNVQISHRRIFLAGLVTQPPPRNAVCPK